ncbi:MAG: serine hydrolase, partial [Thermoanaerobaculales bacterium]|nr:serine hydrolase [Thermoanaerobaculales bacterium]
KENQSMSPTFELDRYVGRREVEGRFSGVVLITRGDEVLYSTARGYASRAWRIPNTLDTRFDTASITKLFTSTAILQLRDQGELRLDDPVSLHLPWFAVPNPVPDAPEITIRHLLTHTSGLPREAAFPYWTDHLFPTRKELAEGVLGQDALNPPETTYHYSNLGMSLLGEVVTAVSGQPWADYVQEMILVPLGMASSSTDPGEELLSGLATAYMLEDAHGNREVMEYYEAGAIAPAGGIVSTVEDLGLFASLQFRDGPVGGKQILKGSTLREMQRPHWVYPSFTGGMGLGFRVNHRDGKNFVGHGGSIGAHVTNLLTVPNEKIAVIVAINADNGSPYTVARQAYEVIAPSILKATQKPAAPAPEADPEWQRYVGLYSDPWGWEYEVMILGGELVIYGYDYPPWENASTGYESLTPVEGATFRRPNKDLVTFELDDAGNVVRVKRNNNYLFPKKK